MNKYLDLMKPAILDMISQRKPKIHISTTLKVVPLMLNNWLKANSDLPYTWPTESASKGRVGAKLLDGSCQLIIDLTSQGVSRADIACRFNVGIGAVHYWISKNPDVVSPYFGTRMRKLDIQKSLIYGMFSENMPRRQLALALNCKLCTFYRWLTKNHDVDPPLYLYNYGKLDCNRHSHRLYISLSLTHALLLWRFRFVWGVWWI